jgi:hypothetical protein
MTTRIDSRQSRQRAALDQLSLNTDVKLDTLLNLNNDEITMPLRLRQANPTTLQLFIDAISVQTSDSGEGHLRTRTIQPISGVLPSFTSGNLTFPGTSGGSITATGLTLAAAYTLTVTSGNWIKVLVQLNTSGQIVLSFGTAGASETAATLPTPVADALSIGYVSMQNVAGTIQNVNGSRIYQFTGSSNDVPSTVSIRELAIQRGTDVATSGTITALSATGNSFIRLTAASTLSGITAPITPVTSGKILILTNTASGVLQVNDQDAGAIAANRIITGTSAPVSLASGASLYLVYDDSSSRWRIVGGTGSGASTKYISQTSHGFTVGQWVSYDTSAYQLANNSNRPAVGIVSLVVDTNSFIVTTSGFVTIAGASYTASGARYFLSTTGSISQTEVIGASTFSQQVFVSTSATTGYVNPGPAIYGADSTNTSGLVSNATQSLGGIKTFLNGTKGKSYISSINSYNSNQTLTSSSDSYQFVAVSTLAGINLTLPSTSIVAGETWTISSSISSTGPLTVKTASTATILVLGPGETAIFECLQATPAALTDWTTLSYSSGTGGLISRNPSQQPVKNYLWTYSSAEYPVGTLSTVAVGGNITVASGTSAFYADTTSGSAALSSSSSTALRGSNNYLSAVSGAALAGTTFFQLPAMTLETADAGKPISISFDTTGNALDGDWDVVIASYDSAGVFKSLIPIAGNASAATSTASAKLPTGTSTFNGFFVSTSTAGDVFALRFRRLANSVQIRIDSLMVGNTPVRVGAAVADWVALASATAGSAAASGKFVIGASTTAPVLGVTQTWNEAWFKRIGDELYFRFAYRQTAAGTAGSGTYRFYLPSEYTIDSTKIDTNGFTGRSIAGSAEISGTNSWEGVVVVGGSNYLLLEVGNATSNPLVYSSTNFVTADGDFDSADMRIGFEGKVPIANWSSNVQMADRAVEEYAWNTDTTNTTVTTGFGNGAGGVLFPNRTVGTAVTKRIQFQTPIQATDKLEFEILTSGGSWMPYMARYPNSTEQNAVAYGFALLAVSSTQLDVLFKAGGTAPGATFGSTTAGNGFDVLFTSGVMWRVRKVSSGAQIGGAISTANIVGRTDGSTVGSGYIGETLPVNAATTTTANTFATSAPLSVPPGKYSVSVFWAADCNTATTFVLGGFSTDSGATTFSDLAIVSPTPNAGQFYATPSTSVTLSSQMVTELTLTTTTTYYAKIRTSGAGVNARCNVKFTRIA